MICWEMLEVVRVVSLLESEVDLGTAVRSTLLFRLVDCSTEGLTRRYLEDRQCSGCGGSIDQ